MNKYILTLEAYSLSNIRRRKRKLNRKNRPFRSVRIEPEPIDSPEMTMPNPLSEETHVLSFEKYSLSKLRLIHRKKRIQNGKIVKPIPAIEGEPVNPNLTIPTSDV